MKSMACDRAKRQVDVLCLGGARLRNEATSLETNQAQGPLWTLCSTPQ
jgi:hypothetical protein